MTRKTKIPDVLAKIKEALSQGNYIYTGHAQIRLQQREVTRQEVKQVIQNGHHEKSKDQFDETYDEWNYSIKGKTIDSKPLRVVISFDENEMLIITVIDLNK